MVDAFLVCTNCMYYITYSELVLLSAAIPTNYFLIDVFIHMYKVVQDKSFLCKLIFWIAHENVLK